MALQLDQSRALRTRAELVLLIEAVHDAAPSESETDALEWKRELDLTNGADPRFQLSKHLLGFGNRSSATAARSFEGCAYLLLGVEPQVLVGCAVWDPAAIDGWVSRYVSPGMPRWSVHYVPVKEAEVLVFTVEAPRAGDPICTLQHTYERFKAGRIFVRRGGTTGEANPAEVRALESRLRSAVPEVELEVSLVGDPGLVPVVFSEEAREAWVQHEFERYRRAQEANQPQPRSPLAIPSIALGDRRSNSEYIAEVNPYLECAGLRWRALAERSAIQRGLGRLHLELRNPTRGNWERVQLELHPPAGVEAYFDDGEPFEVLDAPQPPEEYGNATILDLSRVTPIPKVDNFEHHSVERQRSELTVRFAPEHLRPGAAVRLDPVHLLIEGYRGEGEALLEVGWRATSTSATGWAEGALHVPLAQQPVDIRPQLGGTDED